MGLDLNQERTASDANEGGPANVMLRDLLRHFPMAIAMLDETGRVLVVNDLFKRTYGRRAVALEPLRTLVHKPTYGWQTIEVPSRIGTKIEGSAQVFRFHGNPILIIKESEDPPLVQEVGQLRARVCELEKLSSTDPLTGTWNRVHFDRVIALEIDRSLRLRQPLSLMIVDIDHFKTINDAFGHLVGDAILCELVDVVRTTIRSADMLFRWGGEEFAVIATSTGHRGAAKLATKIRSEVERHRFSGVGTVTVSIGVAEHVATEAVDDWFGRTDAALYRAKNEGRNRVCGDQRGSSDLWVAESGRSVVRLVWQEAYECGEATIDEEHHQLFELANALLDAKDSPDAFRAALDRLLGHTVRHFANEEALLERRGYGRLEAHKRAHAGLLARAGELKASVEAGTATLGSLIEFLANTVVAQHMFKADKDYFPLFHS